MSKIGENITKAWITTLIGIVMIVSSIASVYVIDAVTWSGATPILILGIVLVISPQNFKDIINNVLNRK